MTFRLAELAERAGGRLAGDGERRISGIRALADAGPDDLSLLTQPRSRAAARTSRAGALLVVPRFERLAEPGGELAGRDLVVVDEPALALVRLLPLFHPEERPRAGIHPTAVVGEGCEIDPSAHVGPYAVVGEGTRIGADAVVESHVAIGRGCRVGRGSRLHPHVVLYDRTELGDEVEIHSGTVVGGDGFGYAVTDGEPVKVPQVGRAVLEDRVEVGVLTAIDRGALGETRVGTACKIDNLVQVGHNTRIGRGSLLAGMTGISGSTTIGERVVMGGNAGSSGHLEIGDGAQVAVRATAMRDVPAGARVAGTPAVELGAWRRQTVALHKLDASLAAIRRRLAALEERPGAGAADAAGREDGDDGDDRDA